MPARMFKIIYSSPDASHDTATSSHIVKYWYRITCPSIWKHNVYINGHLQTMKRRETFDWIQCQYGGVFWLFCLLTTHSLRHAHIQTIAGYYKLLRGLEIWARSLPRPAVTWPAVTPHRKCCHIIAHSPPRPTVTWPAVSPHRNICHIIARSPPRSNLARSPPRSSARIIFHSKVSLQPCNRLNKYHGIITNN